MADLLDFLKVTITNIKDYNAFSVANVCIVWLMAFAPPTQGIHNVCKRLPDDYGLSITATNIKGL